MQMQGGQGRETEAHSGASQVARAAAQRSRCAPELPQKGSSSTGRASVSKTEGWGFESLLPCHPASGRRASRTEHDVEALEKTKQAMAPRLAWVRDSWTEVRHKVTWPSKAEVTGTTRVVLVAVVVFAVVVGLMDSLMAWILKGVFALFA